MRRFALLLAALTLAAPGAAQDAPSDQDIALAWLFGDCLDYVLTSAQPFADEATSALPPEVLSPGAGPMDGVMLRSGTLGGTWGIRDGKSFCTIFALTMTSGLEVDPAAFMADVNAQAADLGLVRILASEEAGATSYWWAETPEVREGELEISVDLVAADGTGQGGSPRSTILVMGVFGPVTTLLN